MSLAAGRFRNRITINRRAAGADAYGQPAQGWVAHATLWADCKPPTGASAAGNVSADRQIAPATYSYRVRWRTDLLPGMQLVDGGRAFSILSVLPDLAARDHVDLVCLIDTAESV